MTESTPSAHPDYITGQSWDHPLVKLAEELAGLGIAADVLARVLRLTMATALVMAAGKAYLDDLREQASAAAGCRKHARRESPEPTKRTRGKARKASEKPANGGAEQPAA